MAKKIDLTEMNSDKRILMIVESPTKVKSIKQFLPKNFIVMASQGHITRLADTGKFNLGLDVDNDFEPKYQITDDKKSIVTKLKEQVKAADLVILASDPDREGEAIAYHLLKELKIAESKYVRVTYHSVTKAAVLEGLANPRKIDMNLVNAAISRESADKIIGYRLTGIARRRTGAKSVGRCQSVGLKLISDREREIKAFSSKVYYELYLKFNQDGKEYSAKYIGQENNRIQLFESEDEVNAVIKECEGNDYFVKSIDTKERNLSSKPPFTTSTYQQECINKLGMTSEKATYCAQKLFEGIDVNGQHQGLITYIRTDSTDMAPEFVQELKAYVINKYGQKYYSPVKQGKKKATDQEAHEAIRPVDLNITPDYLASLINDDDLIRVYKLIYDRTVASSMSTAVYTDTVYTFNNKENLFQMTLSQLIFSGFKSVYNYTEDDEDIEDKCNLKLGNKLENTELNPIRKETKPPHRYSESSLIKKLEDLGIGRPSTYSTIIKTLKDKNRGFCDIENKSFIPTELGLNTSQFLDESFSNVINLDYTAKLESNLDLIAQGQLERINFLKDFYTNLEQDIEKVDPNGNVDTTKEQKLCPKCGKPLQIKKGPYSIFLGCTNYPNCKYTESIYKKR